MLFLQILSALLIKTLSLLLLVLLTRRPYRGQDIPLARFPHHPTLWYEDGNVLLTTDAYIYRVHKGVLQQQSSLFRTTLLVHGGAAGRSPRVVAAVGAIVEEWDELTVVQLSDPDEDVCHLLMTLYNRRYVLFVLFAGIFS